MDENLFNRSLLLANCFRFLGAAWLSVFPLLATADDWPQFRGRSGSATNDDTGLPLSWSDENNVIWKTELPGFGASSPVVIGDHVFLTCYSGYGLDVERPGETTSLERHLLSIDRNDGNITWKRNVPAAAKEANYVDFLPQHGYATNTPACNGDRVYAFFGAAGVQAFDLEGTRLWQADVGHDVHNWGSAGSPVVYGDLLYVNAAVESDAFVALDKLTGREAWRVKRLISSWSTPLVVDVPGGEPELVVSVKGRLIGLRPKTGEELWVCKTKQAYGAPSPIEHDGLIYAFGGRPNMLLAIRPGGRGDVTESHVAWRAAGVGSAITSPVWYDGHLYSIDERGMAGCVVAATGEVVYKERIAEEGVGVYASPVAADGKIYAVSREQGTFVLAAGGAFKRLAVNRLTSDDSVFNATPAISRGQLLLRSNRFLYCIGGTR